MRVGRPTGGRSLGSALSGASVAQDVPFGLPGLIRQRSLEHPDRIACRDAERAITWQDLEFLSDQLAARLDAAGLADGPVALRLPRGIDVVVSMLAVLKAGRAYLPIGMEEPDQRVALIAARATPVALIADEATPALEGLPRLATPRTVHDDAIQPAALRTVAPHQPVYVMFTSGSTGEPKGVVLGSAALCNRLLWMRRRYDLQPTDKVLQKTAYTFDVSGWEIFWPLIAGACCVFAPEGAHRDPVAIGELIQGHQITVSHFVPSMLAEFLRVPKLVDVAASLRMVFTSGEALSTALARRTHEALDADLHNLYGPTEAAIEVTAWQVPRDLAADQPVLIGKPIDNTDLLVVDDHGEPVPAGAPGELWIGGMPVAEGYIGRTDLTAIAFPSSFGQRYYRTGDLVRSTEDGLEYLGRMDDQVKIDGVRVEPLEVEHILSTLPAVAQVGVVRVDDRDGSARLVAAVIPSGAGALDEHGLRISSVERLPTAFRPAGFLVTDRLPLNSSGKLDRRQLRETAQAWWDRRVTVEGTDPLRAAWTTALRFGDEQVDEGLGFLASGGESLAAVRLVARLREELCVEVPLRFLLDQDMSLARLRTFVAEAPTVAPPPSVGTGSGRRSSSPLAPEQRRLWLISRLYPASAAYNVAAALRLNGVLDRAALNSALDLAVRRHDILRARVAEDEDSAEPVLRYADLARFDLIVRETQEPISDSTAEAFAAEVAAVEVSDGSAPMARAHLLSSPSNAQHCLVLVFNHLAADQRTVDLLLSEIAADYSAAHLGEAVQVSPRPSYAAHAHSAATRQSDPSWTADIAYWRSLLDGAPPELPLPFRAASPLAPDFRGGVSTAHLDAAFFASLRAYLREARATTANFFLSVFAVVLSAWSGQNTIVIGVPASRRRREAEQDLAGFLVDTLPIRLDLGEYDGFDELLAHTRARYVDAIEHATPSFDEIVSALPVSFQAHRNPVFHVWLNDLTDGGEVPAFAGLDAEAMLPPVPGALFDLGLYLYRQADGLTLRLVRSVSAYSGEVAAEILEQCVAAARRVVTAGAPVPWHALDLVTERAARILPRRPATAPPPGPRPDVLTGIARLANAHSDAPAVVTDATTLSYRELWDAVCQHADVLRSHGVQAGDIVEIRADRTVHLPVATLAGWHAGAAVALMDASLPAERLEYYRATLHPRVCVTTRERIDVSPIVDGGRDGVATAPVTELSHVLFTSGSTGEPAAVAVPHGPLHDFLTWYTAEFGVCGTDRFALTAGPGHDPVLRDMFTPLWLGAQLHVPPVEAFADPGRLRAWIASREVTVLHVTPGLLELVLTADGPPLPRLRLLVVGGAPLTYGLARAARAVTSARIITAYGTTETPQIVAYHEIDGPELAAAPDGAVAPIGFGVGAFDLTVRTLDGRLAGIGQRGEIVVRGHNLATGYLGGLRDAGFGTDTSGPFYRTGDLARVDPDGRIHVDGRLDRQVQVDGYRVELAEVEGASLRHPAVRHAVARLANTDLGPVLTLDVDTDRAAGLTVEALRSHLRLLLPAAAVPASIRIVTRFVLGPTQKLVPGAPDENIPASLPTSRSPRSSDQALGWLRQAFSDVIDHAIGDDENFFEAGLNSVLLLRLHVRLTQALDRTFPITAMFAHPNLRALARYLNGATPEHDEPSRRVHPAGRELLTNERQARRDFRRRLREESRSRGSDM